MSGYYSDDGNNNNNDIGFVEKNSRLILRILRSFVIEGECKKQRVFAATESFERRQKDMQWYFRIVSL